MALKMYASVDIQGISGGVRYDHTGRDGEGVKLARRLTTRETDTAKRWPRYQIPLTLTLQVHIVWPS